MFALLLLLASAFLGLGQAETLVIYHTNDVHGWVFPQTVSRRGSSRKIGGYAALASLVKKEKHPTLLLDSGDIFQGTPEGDLTKGEASVELMNAMGYAAMAIGNHDFDWGQENLARLASLARFPFLGANIYQRSGQARRKKGQRPDYAKPYVLVEAGGVRFGIFGLVVSSTYKNTSPKNVQGLYFGSEPGEAARMVRELKAKKADVIIALTHVGLVESLALRDVDPTNWRPEAKDLRYEGDLHIARKARGIDLILGGHHHTGLLYPYRDPVSGVWICQSGAHLKTATRLELDWDDSARRLRGIKGKLLELRPDETGEDPQIRRLVETFQSRVGGDWDEVVGEAAEDFPRPPHALGTPIGNWFADAMRKAAKTEIAFHNTLGIRKDLRKGPVTRRHLYAVMPFDNTLVMLRITGRQVLEILRESLRGRESFMEVSGLSVKYRLSRNGEDAREIGVRVGGEPLKEDRVYSVATNSYLVSVWSLKASRKWASQDTKISLREVLTKDFKENSPVRAPEERRIQILEN